MAQLVLNVEAHDFVIDADAGTVTINTTDMTFENLPTQAFSVTDPVIYLPSGFRFLVMNNATGQVYKMG